MIGRNRNQDLTEVFNQTWRANHNNDVKLAKEKEKRFVNKMFNVKEKSSFKNQIDNTPNAQVERLQTNIDGVINSQRQMDVKGFTNKYK